MEVGEIPSVIDDGGVNVYRPISGFLQSGHYSELEYGGFPFGVQAYAYFGGKESAAIESTKNLNTHSTYNEDINLDMTRRKSDGLFISLPVSKKLQPK